MAIEQDILIAGSSAKDGTISLQNTSDQYK